MEKYKDLSDQIWTTRISRVNAEKRLVNKEAFFQGINIYYSFGIIYPESCGYQVICVKPTKRSY